GAWHRSLAPEPGTGAWHWSLAPEPGTGAWHRSLAPEAGTGAWHQSLTPEPAPEAPSSGASAHGGQPNVGRLPAREALRRASPSWPRYRSPTAESARRE